MSNHWPTAKLPRWFFLPPLIALVLILLIRFTGWETRVFLWINHGGEFAGDMFWTDLTMLGDGLVVLALLLPFIRRKPELVWAMILSWLLAALWVKGLKNLQSMPRPLTVLPATDFHLIGAQYRFNSFPSGHAAIATMFAAVFCLFFKQRWLRASVFVLALLVSLSRIAMGVHWMTDVLVGFLGGWLMAGVGYLLAIRFRFGTSTIAQIIFGVVLTGASIFMLVKNYSDYPEAFRWQQTIVLASLVFTAGDMYLGLRKADSSG
ncbi:MAG TPA: phosphatase PAP2 family protein [Pyrinomonadaceae bacterium]